MSKPPEEAREVLVRLDGIFDEARDFDEIKCQIRSLILEHEEGSALRIGLQTGLDILDDGSDTIYSPSNRYYRNLAAIASEGVTKGTDSNSGTTVVFNKKKGAKEDAKDIGKADVAGAVVGGAVGLAAAGVGAGPGAVAGAVTASFAKSVEKAVDAVLDWIW